MNDFSLALDEETKQASRLVGEEWLIPASHIERGIDAADWAEIAILGVDAFTIHSDGLVTENYTGYQFERTQDWSTFVKRNDLAAREWLKQFGRSQYSYILTTDSMAWRNKWGLNG